MIYFTLRHTTPFRPGEAILGRNLALLHYLLWLSTFGLYGIISTSLWSANAVAAAQAEQEVRSLKVGESIERELDGGQSHAYQIIVAEGQYLHLVVEQRGIDVIVRLLGPDGKQVAEFDSEIRKHGQETVSQVAEVTGRYQMNVEAKEKGAAAGRYEIRVVELRVATEKDRTLQEARKLHTESRTLYRAGKYDEAHPLAKRALEIREKELGPDNPAVASSLNNIANIYHNKGDYARAEPLYQRALDIREKVLGPDHPDVAQSLINLAVLYQGKGDYARAEPLFQRALDIWKKTLGPNHLDVAPALNNLGNLYQGKGDYARAEPLYQRALDIWEKVLGPDHPYVAAALNNLALLYEIKGDYVKAELLYQRALANGEKTLGPDHPDFASSLNNLAMLYRDKGDYAKAEPLYQRALDISEKALGSDHSDVAQSLINLANLYTDKGDYLRAEPLYQRALTIKEKTLGPNHPDVALALNNLAILYRNRGDYARAEPLYQRALDIREKVLGPNHDFVASSLYNLASLYSDKGDYAKAEPPFQRALAIREKALGPEHPLVAHSLNKLARLYTMKGDLTQAMSFQSRAGVISERNTALNLATGSERQKLVYLATLSELTDQTIFLHVHSAPNNPTARDLATTTILQRKGRALDSMFDSFGILRRRFNAQDQVLLDEMKETNSQLARKILNGPQRISLAEHQKQIKTLEERKEALEASISRSTEFRVQAQLVTLDTVQSAIPGDAALIEFFSYRPFNAKYTKPAEAFGQPHYVVYVLRRQNEPQWVELGEAMAIDNAVAAWRKALRDPQRADMRRLARKVDEQVMRPVRALLGNTRHVFISPDSTLNLVPFAALVDEQNHFLVERYSFSYLTSGRDLLRLQARLASKSEPVIMADPAFGERANATLTRKLDVELRPNPQPSATQGLSLDRIYFPQLPATADEGKALKSILPQATVFTRVQATEAALKHLNSPRILHIATHGFFLEDIETKLADTRDVILLGGGSAGFGGAKLENPLLRSGLALAGANLRQSGSNQEDDGVLTAMEVAGLDLWGTKLVVLSACDTGVGEVKNGEGVYGLRRALVLAGSETQVMSLWPVSDVGTRDLMINYYKALQRGEGRAEALRRVQLRMLKRKDRSHPFYWASFIQSGEWANLEGKR